MHVPGWRRGSEEYLLLFLADPTSLVLPSALYVVITLPYTMFYFARHGIFMPKVPVHGRKFSMLTAVKMSWRQRLLSLDKQVENNIAPWVKHLPTLFAFEEVTTCTGTSSTWLRTKATEGFVWTPRCWIRAFGDYLATPVWSAKSNSALAKKCLEEPLWRVSCRTARTCTFCPAKSLVCSLCHTRLFGTSLDSRPSVSPGLEGRGLLWGCHPWGSLTPRGQTN